MTTALDYRNQIVFNAALRLAVSNLTEIPQKIYDQPLTACILDDMSDLNFEEQAVNDFINMFTWRKYSDLTVGSLRGMVKGVFTGCSASHVAARWTCSSEERGLKALSQRCSRGENLTHLNQLLLYIGGRSLNESFEIANKSQPTYPKGSQYNNVRYSLCVNFTWDCAEEYSTTTEVIDYQEINLLQLLDESRYVLEKFLIGITEASDVGQAGVTINHIGVCLNEVEVLAFPIDQFVADMYHNELSLKDKLPEARSLTGVENFAEVLLSGNLFRSRECYVFKQHLKGKVLEHELGM